MIFYKPIQIPSTLFDDRIAIGPPAVCGIEVAVVVVNQP